MNIIGASCLAVTICVTEAAAAVFYVTVPLLIEHVDVGGK
jgi:hypothetical protein